MPNKLIPSAKLNKRINIHETNIVRLKVSRESQNIIYSFSITQQVIFNDIMHNKLIPSAKNK